MGFEFASRASKGARSYQEDSVAMHAVGAEGASSRGPDGAGTTLTAVGCGLEVDGSQTVTQKTSVVRITGSATSASTTPLDRVDRTAVQAGEEFKMKGSLKNGVLTCEVTIKGNQTTTAKANVGALKGSIGLFTKQTKALFKQINACKLD